MRSRPVVAITGPDKGGFSRFFIVLAVWLAGGRPRLVTPKIDFATKDFDALIISGGDDLNHALFEEESCELDDIIDSKRDALEYTMLLKAVQEKHPVMGICRGYQLINVFFGGTLIKDIRKPGQKLRYTPLAWKPVKIDAKSCLKTIVGKNRIKINTLHHQAIKTPANGFQICAKDREGIIQSIRHDEREIFGIQWHPEYLFYRKEHFLLFKHLITQARG